MNLSRQPVLSRARHGQRWWLWRSVTSCHWQCFSSWCRFWKNWNGESTRSSSALWLCALQSVLHVMLCFSSAPWRWLLRILASQCCTPSTCTRTRVSLDHGLMRSARSETCHMEGQLTCVLFQTIIFFGMLDFAISCFLLAHKAAMFVVTPNWQQCRACLGISFLWYKKG